MNMKWYTSWQIKRYLCRLRNTSTLKAT